ncbi:MAG TPA: BamA/TamA family outer membrane protein, partial [Candidatus Eisenbacteria bacterium]|nr:BamA/TamA family outer membrane protein [Candidatus Eisenbacteria bacterium]
EKALRAPFRVVFYPVRLAARGSQAAITFGTQFINYEPRLIPWLGVKAAPVFGISGTSGPAAGFAIQGRSGIGARATLVGTWSVKDTRRLRLRASITEPEARAGLELNAAYDYRPNRRFYGIGNASDEDDKSIYLRRENVAEAMLILGKSPYRRIRGIASVSGIDVGAGYRDEQRAQDVFDPEDVPFLTEGSTVASFGAGYDFALLDDVAQPSRGIHLRGEARRFGSLDEANVHYVSWFAEGRAYVPVLASRRVIALRYVYQGVNPRDGSDPVPFYRMPTSSNEVRFAAFRSNRFMDQQLMLGHAEYRWIVLPQYSLWASVFTQYGAVESTAEAFRASNAHRSIGGGLRVVLSPSTTARLEIAGGDEGTRIYLDLRGDF